MVDALVSGASVERRAGSSPVLGTKPNEYLTGWNNGEMAELVDALLWGGSDRWVVWVRVSFSSPKTKKNLKKIQIAEIAQLVEHNLAKVRVASSSLVFRSKERGCIGWYILFPFISFVILSVSEGSVYTSCCFFMMMLCIRMHSIVSVFKMEPLSAMEIAVYQFQHFFLVAVYFAT